MRGVQKRKGNVKRKAKAGGGRAKLGKGELDRERASGKGTPVAKAAR